MQGNELRLVTVDEICYFQADNKYTLVVTPDQESLIRRPIKELIDELDPKTFWQIHRGDAGQRQRDRRRAARHAGRLRVQLKQRKETLAVSEPYKHLFQQMSQSAERHSMDWGEIEDAGRYPPREPPSAPRSPGPGGALRPAAMPAFGAGSVLRRCHATERLEVTGSNVARVERESGLPLQGHRYTQRSSSTMAVCNPSRTCSIASARTSRSADSTKRWRPGQLTGRIHRRRRWLCGLWRPAHAGADERPAASRPYAVIGWSRVST